MRATRLPTWPTDLADPDETDGAATGVPALEDFALDPPHIAQRAVGLRYVLGQREHHCHRVLGNSIGIGAGLVYHQHTGRRAGREVDGIVARPGRGHGQKVGTALEQCRVALVFVGHFVPCRGDAIDVRGRHRPPVVRRRTGERQPMDRNVLMLRKRIRDIRALAVIEPEYSLRGLVFGHVKSRTKY